MHATISIKKLNSEFWYEDLRNVIQLSRPFSDGESLEYYKKEDHTNKNHYYQ